MPNYSGVWTLQEQYEAILEGNWTGIIAGELYTWGENDDGQLLQNDINIERSSPTQVGSDTEWQQVKSLTKGFESALMIKSDGTLWSGGRGLFGNTGLNDEINRSSPTQVGSETDWEKVSCYRFHTMALTSGGELYSWGEGANGQTGQNDTVNRSSPVQIGSDTDWTDVATGGRGTLAVKSDGTLWSWGRNTNGNLGNGTQLTDLSSPTQIGALTNWASVGGGELFHGVVKTDGTLWMFGRNNFGQLGTNNTTDRSSPVQVGSDTDWVAVQGSEGHTLALKTDGSIYSWGYNVYGGLGHNDITYRSSPVQIGALTNWETISLGSAYRSAAIKTNGTLWTWGRALYGALGHNDQTNRSSPTQVGTDAVWDKVAIGPYGMIASTFSRTGMS